MTEAEKELSEFMLDNVNGILKYEYTEILESLAKALITRYPQIKAEKVWEGHRDEIENKFFLNALIGTDKKVKVYMEVVKTPELLEGKS